MNRISTTEADSRLADHKITVLLWNPYIYSTQQSRDEVKVFYSEV
jgi:hypothetical protein